MPRKSIEDAKKLLGLVETSNEVWGYVLAQEYDEDYEVPEGVTHLVVIRTYEED